MHLPSAQGASGNHAASQSDPSAVALHDKEAHGGCGAGAEHEGNLEGACRSLRTAGSRLTLGLQVRSMKRARDVRDQLVGLMERVEIDMVSHPEDHEGIKKANPLCCLARTQQAVPHVWQDLWICCCWLSRLSASHALGFLTQYVAKPR